MSELDPQYTTVESDDLTPEPTEYDRQQDEKLSEKDKRIAELESKLAELQTAPADVVTEVPSDETAKFHEVRPAANDEGSAGGDTFGDLPVGDVPTVALDPAPELDGKVTATDAVKNQEELREAVAEILVKVREIHETVEWVKKEAPKIGAALSDSPFGKLMPSFLNNI